MSQQCLEFVTVDVFTSETFGGNPLAVFFAAEHLRDQQIARMFAPLQGMPEDPATGSAAGALAGLLAQQDRLNGHMLFEITQSVEMGRPSRIVVDVERNNGQISKTSIVGECVEVISGWLSL